MRIDGKKLAQELFDEIRTTSKTLPNGVIPHLAIITVGEESSWETYVTQKQKRAEDLGFNVTLFNHQGATTTEVITRVEELNRDAQVHGIIIQRPLPESIDTGRIINAIDVRKDVDGFKKESEFKPPIWLAVEHILEYIYRDIQPETTYPQWLYQQQITVVGKGETAGKPVIEGLYRQNIIPKIIDSSTSHPEDIFRQSDIIISGVGKTILNASILKKGVILIGIGIRREDGVLKGDYLESEIDEIASWYTPTPGGVGRINLAFLMYNLTKAAQRLSQIS